jgi:hypothetical protein
MHAAQLTRHTLLLLPHALVPAHNNNAVPAATTCIRRVHPPSMQDFNAWLTLAVVQRPSKRHASLLRWRQAPGAAAAHPREEHLMPLLVVAGAADGAGDGSDDGNGSGGGGDNDAVAAAAGSVLWEGECMGAAVCAVAFGTVRPAPRDG